MSSEQPTPPWYTQTWVAVVALLLFFPLGLFLMWRFTRWQTWLKTAITVVLSLLTILFVVGAAIGEEDETSEAARQELSPSPTADASPSPTVEPPAPTPESSRAPEPMPEPTPTPMPTPKPLTAPLELKLTVWDDTDTNPLVSRVPGDAASVELWMRGLGSWYPDLTFGGDFTFVGPYEIASQELFVYPDGRDGREVKVILMLTDDMISRSDRDTIWVDIYDGKVVVAGSAIQDFEQEFAR